MVITFTLEAIFAVYTFIRYGTNRFGKIAALLLLLLGTFQLAESRICADASAFVWMRIGFVAITLLPVVGLYLVSLVSHKTHFLRLGYALAALFVVAFLFVPKVITGALCAGNYVIFNTNQSLYVLYGIYYLGFMLLAIWEALEKIHEPHVQSKTRTTLFWIIIGYLSFMLPMAATYIIIPSTRVAIASVMCGFALILAFILTFVIVPRFNRIRKNNYQKAAL